MRREKSSCKIESQVHSKIIKIIKIIKIFLLYHKMIVYACINIGVIEEVTMEEQLKKRKSDGTFPKQ